MRNREKNRKLTDWGYCAGGMWGTGNNCVPKHRRGPVNPVLKDCKKYLKVMGQCQQKVKAGESGALRAFADLINVRYLKNILSVMDEESRELRGLTDLKVAKEMTEK